MKGKLKCIIVVLCVGYATFVLRTIDATSVDSDWDMFRCTNIKPEIDEKTIILVATDGFSVNEEVFCVALRKNLKVRMQHESGKYDISSQMISTFSKLKSQSIGLAFNVRDENNFDFAIFSSLNQQHADRPPFSGSLDSIKHQH